MSQRIVAIAALPQTAPPLVAALRSLGHEVPLVISARRPADWPGHLLSERDLPADVDLAVPHAPTTIAGLLQAYAPDTAVSYGYPRRLLASALSVPRLGVVNCHPSALPRYRGPNPLGWAVRNGDDSIGVTWHRMDAELDTGAILAQSRIPLSEDDWSFTSVNNRVLDTARALLPQVLDRLARQEPGEHQPEQPTSWAGFFSDDYAEIDWSRSAHDIHTQVRAWNIAGHHPRLAGPVTVLDGTRWRIRRTTLRQPPQDTGRLVRCGQEQLWITAADPLTGDLSWRG